MKLNVIAIGVGLCLSGTPSAQAVIMGNVLDNGNGTFTYSYTIQNDRTFDIFAFTLEFGLTPGQIDWNQADTGSGGAVTVPNADWLAQAGIPTSGNSAQDFSALTSVVTVGDSLGGFSFISAFPPDRDIETIEFGGNGESQTGVTVGPSAVGVALPESCNTLLLVSSILPGLVLIRRRVARNAHGCARGPGSAA